jgi:hypothetical protein
MRHHILVEFHVHLAVLFADVLALMQLGFGPLPIGATCLNGGGDVIHAHDIRRVTQEHVLQ